jgi:hypothetical protein
MILLTPIWLKQHIFELVAHIWFVLIGEDLVVYNRRWWWWDEFLDLWGKRYLKNISTPTLKLVSKRGNK